MRVVVYALIAGLILSVYCEDVVVEETPATSVAGETVALPDVDPSSDAIKLKLGEKVAVTGMGPMVIQKDGSTKRITNWDKMTKGEQEAAYRRITKRNRERSAILKKKIAEGEAEDAKMLQQRGDSETQNDL